MICLIAASVIAVGVAPWSIGAGAAGLPDHRRPVRYHAASLVSVKARSSCSW
jgi:hypothetical protein